MSVFVVVGSVFLFIAAAVHVMIFFFESILWSKPPTWKRFGVKTQEDAETVKSMAFNQGFYNLFLAIGIGVGLVLLGTGNTAAGIAIAMFAALSMVAAALVLIISSPKLARAAAIQGTAPLLGSVFLVLALLG